MKVDTVGSFANQNAVLGPWRSGVPGRLSCGVHPFGGVGEMIWLI